jgi:hypothetical protein
LQMLHYIQLLVVNVVIDYVFFFGLCKLTIEFIDATEFSN